VKRKTVNPIDATKRNSEKPDRASAVPKKAIGVLPNESKGGMRVQTNSRNRSSGLPGGGHGMGCGKPIHR
jgi:hypothetical protein